ncbi:assembly protein [Photobacterium angustum]|uniref:zonular occludens toxin domain-containing protein n=1 Tax=Photobacterium angustum TaxID=661 RepID=UPI0005EB6862|nr:zonular occludens toxin domain-containing protein [Photobacterium angustum]PSW85946.1 assembly protein [Photobacterium angustum]
MINLILGRPRSGKSYESVVYHLIPAIQSGRKVITNLPVNIDAIRSVFGEAAADLVCIVKSDFHAYGDNSRPFSSPSDYQDPWRDGDGKAPLYIVDEAHMVLGRNARADLLEFYSMHGHMGIDILLMTQSDRKLHRDVRDMVEIVYRCIKNTALGSDKTYTKKVLMGLRGDVVNTEQRKYNKSYFKFYQSHTASNTAVKEATASDVKPFWKSKLVIMLVICVILSVAGLFNLLKDGSPFGVKEVKSEPSSAPVLEVRQVKKEKVDIPAQSLLSFFPFLTDVSKAYITAMNVTRKGDKTTFDMLFKVFDKKDRYYVPDSTLADMQVKIQVINECLVKLMKDNQFVYLTCPPITDEKIKEDKKVSEVVSNSFLGSSDNGEAI